MMDDIMWFYYFAYGSNMDQDRMKNRCKGCAKFTIMFRGIMKNWQLVFNKISKHDENVVYANIMPKESAMVEGVIYKINEKCRDELDYWEGYPEDYQRPNMLVESDNGKLDCVVYIANPAKVREGLKPTKEYLSHLLEGRDFLSPNYISFLEKIPTFEEK